MKRLNTDFSLKMKCEAKKFVFMLTKNFVQIWGSSNYFWHTKSSHFYPIKCLLLRPLPALADEFSSCTKVRHRLKIKYSSIYSPCYVPVSLKTVFPELGTLVQFIDRIYVAFLKGNGQKSLAQKLSKADFWKLSIL